MSRLVYKGEQVRCRVGNGMVHRLEEDQGENNRKSGWGGIRRRNDKVIRMGKRKKPVVLNRGGDGNEKQDEVVSTDLGGTYIIQKFPGPMISFGCPHQGH